MKMQWRAIFFGVNFAAAVGWVVSVADFIGDKSDGSTFALVTGAVMASPGIVVMVAEWLLFARRVRVLERPLGVLAGVAGALALIALITNASEAALKGGSQVGVLFWIGFTGVCLGISAYSFWCCRLRVRRLTLPEEWGFPVGGPAAP
jgi:hypothetical protein